MTAQHATLAFLTTADAVLLAEKKRGFGAGFWNGVGGKIEPGEAIVAALARECAEEVGVVPTAHVKVAELDFRQAGVAEPWHLYAHVYRCDRWTGEPRESEEMAPRWFPLDAVPYAQMWSDDVHWLPAVLAGATVLGAFTFDADDRLLTHDVRTVGSVADLPHGTATHVD